MQLSQALQLADLLGDVDQVILAQYQLKSLQSVNFTPLIFKYSHYNLQILEESDLGWEELKVVVGQVKGAQGLDHEEVSRQTRLVEIVVGQVEHLQRREGAETARQRVQTVDAKIGSGENLGVKLKCQWRTSNSKFAVWASMKATWAAPRFGYWPSSGFPD